MTDDNNDFIDAHALRIGHFVYVDMSWISHPFPVNSFRIHSAEQIETIRSLGLGRVRISIEKSDPALFRSAEPVVVSKEEDPAERAKRERRALLDEQLQSLQACERQFGEAARNYRKVSDLVHAQPQQAYEAAQLVVNGMLGDLVGQQESCIRLLSEKVGERSAQHSINVTVLALLLAKAMGSDEVALADVGHAALLHDLGKIDLPDRLRLGDHLSPAEENLYQEHVVFGVALARKMGVPPAALLGIAQHHEASDASGYPQHVSNERIGLVARVVALVNRYDNLCNPGNPAHAVTPHEALAQIYAQSKNKFDATTLAAFIRMMGVYPPGTVVQLNDDRYAIVVSVNATRPLKPRMIIFDEKIPRTEALVFDLANDASLAIRRSLRPLQLPRAAIDYLAPRERICYYFEHAREAGSAGGGLAAGKGAT